jgi:hypothetical protein
VATDRNHRDLIDRERLGGEALIVNDLPVVRRLFRDPTLQLGPTSRRREEEFPESGRKTATRL